MCNASRRCLANNLPVLISAAGLGELALWHQAATQSIWEEARMRAKSSLYLSSGASQEGGCWVKREQKAASIPWDAACLPACLLDASMGKAERMAFFLNNWPARWQSRYYGNVNLITERDISWKSLAEGRPREYLRVSQCVPPSCALPGLSHFKNNLFLYIGWHISPIASVDPKWCDALRK